MTSGTAAVPDVPLYFRLFAVLDLVQILKVDPFFRKAAPAADIAVHIHCRKDRYSDHHIISSTITARISIDADDVIAAALGANLRCFHIAIPFRIVSSTIDNELFSLGFQICDLRICSGFHASELIQHPVDLVLGIGHRGLGLTDSVTNGPVCKQAVEEVIRDRKSVV